MKGRNVLGTAVIMLALIALTVGCAAAPVAKTVTAPRSIEIKPRAMRNKSSMLIHFPLS